VDIVVKGRHCDVPDRFRTHVSDKLAKIERWDGKVARVDVEVSKERNPRLADQSDRVEITCRSRGPVIRAEAAAADAYAALDLAWSRLEARLRRAADRRRVSHGQKTPVSVAAATAELDPNLAGLVAPTPATAADDQPADAATQAGSPVDLLPDHHRAPAMTLDQALYEMELVGHDFFLFLDAETTRPSVVYRRRGWDYGVLRLETDG
jgi:ribosomal subunit interface protein